RRPAGLPTDSSLRSASVFDGAPKIKIKKKRGGLVADRFLEAGLSFKCGSGLAREGGVSAITSLTDPPLSRASPLPQF
ncbi:hypothetical protein, partial [Pseudomonas reactans]|uniref:hypothetical protein n=1 Tax=Pseudomonas reactans TaxID=117680 RepID=UPI001C434A49